MERNFLDKASSGIKRIFSVNTKLQFAIAKAYQINPDIIEPLVVGPNLDLWKPPEAYGDYILWKGNAKHMVKDIAFGRQVESRLKKYKFVFLGDKVPYNYMQHINVAKKAFIYFSTSLSETKGMALLEQWACGVPSVTHPKIYLHGENYKTGIITNRDVASYCEAIEEIVEDKSLRDYMSKNARKWVEENFRPQKLEEQYIRAIENAC
jgi:glycosyltransferase involved in cell wall biosynthesis